ncbi:MAG: hypothetical protein RL329_2202 [Bacteroidota bacterium]|jgi:hypothetical protein
MRNNSIVLSIFTVFVLFAVSCKKEKEKTKTELLTAKTWVLTSLTVNPGIYNAPDKPLITDLFTQQVACENDNITTYNVNGKYSIDEGALKCDAQDEQNYENGSWSFNTGETELTTASASGINSTYTLLDLNATTLKANVSETLQGVKYTLTYTFSAK